MRRKERTIEIDDTLWARLEARYTEVRAAHGERAPTKSEFFERLIGAGLEAVEPQLAAPTKAEGRHDKTPRPPAGGPHRHEPAEGGDSASTSRENETTSLPDAGSVEIGVRLSTDVRDLLETAAASRNESVHAIIQRGILTELERLALSDASESLFQTPSARANGDR